MIRSLANNSRKNKRFTRSAKRAERSSATYRVSLKAIIRNQNGEVLVVKEKGRIWSLPGGGIEHGETDRQALKRELLEEVAYGGDFEARPVATAAYYAKSSRAWKFWVVYDVKTKTNDFGVGLDAHRIAFLDPRTFKNSTRRAEQLVYEICVDRVRLAKVSPRRRGASRSR